MADPRTPSSSSSTPDERPPLVDAAAREAIRSALDETLAVEAAAGTGKTTVLVERIVNVLAQGLTTVDRLVAVTFTEKAAGELKLRLRARLDVERERAASDAVRAHLDAALANLEQAHVSTIHGFCADLLRERPVEARVDPQFTTLTEAQAERLYGELFRDWLQRRLEDPPEGVRRALRRPSFDAENGPINRLQRAGWTLVEWRDFDGAWRRDPFARDAAIDRLVLELDSFAKLTESPGDRRDPIFEGSRDARRLQLEIMLGERVRPRDYDGLEARLVELANWRFRNLSYGRRNNPYRKGLPRTEVIVAHQQLVAALEQFQRAADADLAARLQQELRETVDRYRAAKSRIGALDFLDLLMCARDLVRDHPAVRAAFQERFTHLFVDEFQDTDPLQAELLLLLAADDPRESDWRAVAPRRGKLFLVGDPKQSIYRFRRADVGIYQQVRDQLAGHGARLLMLTTNFRSAPTIQRFVNAGFAPIMRGDATVLQADYVPLTPARDDVAGQPGVVALSIPRPFGARGYVTKEAINGSLPDAIGAFVHWLIARSGWTVTERDAADRPVPIQARHVCLLFRRFDTRDYAKNAMVDMTRPYVQALEARGIPHVLVGGKSFHEREEVETLRTALAAVEWPDDELSVFGTLRGAFFAIDDESLFAYRQRFKRLNPFRQAGGDDDAHATPSAAAAPAAPAAAPATSVAATDDAWADRFRPIDEALEILRDLHLRRNYRPVAETIARLLDASRAHVAFALRPSGEQALANVLHIAELARQYEASGGISFRGFVEQLRDEAETTRSAEAPILEEGSDGVRIMTVHKAKGLEFPVVILADTTAELSRKTASRWVDTTGGRCAVSLAGWAPADLRDHEAEEVARDEAEGVRVAYVAATRARDLLVVPAVGDEPQNGWVKPVAEALYPETDVRRDGAESAGCPRFGKDSVLDREGPMPFTNVSPGRHRLPGYAASAAEQAASTDAARDASGASDSSSLDMWRAAAAHVSGTANDGRVRGDGDTTDDAASATSSSAMPTNAMPTNAALATGEADHQQNASDARGAHDASGAPPASAKTPASHGARVLAFPGTASSGADAAAGEPGPDVVSDATTPGRGPGARASGATGAEADTAESRWLFADARGATEESSAGTAAAEPKTNANANASAGAGPGADDSLAYDVVWWDPATLDLGRAPAYGLRREELIAKDAPPQVVREGLERYYTWRAAREGATERGGVPTMRVLTVRARAAALGEAPPVVAAIGVDPDATDDAAREAAEEAAAAAEELAAEAAAAGIDTAADLDAQRALLDAIRVDIIDARIDVVDGASSGAGAGAGAVGGASASANANGTANASETASTSGGARRTRPGGARFGALVHAVLGFVPLDAPADAVERLIDQQARVLGATADERTAAGPVIAATLRHPLFDRARVAAARGGLRRETPLALTDARGAIIEGVIDLAFEDDAGWTIVDFKTDQELEAVSLDAYRRQIQLYAHAISRATGRPASGILLRV